MQEPPNNKTTRPAAKALLTELKSTAERYIGLAPENAHFRSLLIRALLALAEEEGLETDQVHVFLRTAEEQAAALIGRDSGNIRWLMDAAGCANGLATAARKNGDTQEHHHWRALLAQRLDRLFQSITTDIDLLKERERHAKACAHHYLPEDWPTARRYYEAIMNARKSAPAIPATSDLLEAGTAQVFKLIEKHEGLPAAEQWRAQFQKSP